MWWWALGCSHGVQWQFEVEETGEELGVDRACRSLGAVTALVTEGERTPRREACRSGWLTVPGDFNIRRRVTVALLDDRDRRLDTAAARPDSERGVWIGTFRLPAGAETVPGDSGGDSVPDPTGPETGTSGPTDTSPTPADCGYAWSGLMISEFRTRGPGGPDDEFVELYNPTDAEIPLGGFEYAVHVTDEAVPGQPYVGWYSTGGAVPARHHFLLGGTGYVGERDGSLAAPLPDDGRLTLVRYGGGIDTVCSVCAAGPSLECGDHVLPRSATTCGDADASIERLPGGDAGHCSATGQPAIDFHEITPSRPEQASDPAVP